MSKAHFPYAFLLHAGKEGASVPGQKRLLTQMVTGSLLSITFVSVGAAFAETYKWTDASGSVHFSDDPAAVPKKYRGKVATTADITLASPEVRQEVEEGRRVAAIIQKEDQERRAALLRREAAYQLERKQAETKVQTEKRAATASTQVKTPAKRRVG